MNENNKERKKANEPRIGATNTEKHFIKAQQTFS